MSRKGIRQLYKNKKDFEAKERNRIRQQFLLSLFDSEPKYQEQNINGFWLVRQFNSNTEKWQVAIFSEETFKRYKEYNAKNQKLF